MIAGVVICGNTGSVDGALAGESEESIAALASTGVGITAEAISSGTDDSRLIGSTGSSVNVVTAGTATSASRGISADSCGVSADSSGNDSGCFVSSKLSLASGAGQVISSTFSATSGCRLAAVAVASVNSLIAEISASSGACTVSKLWPFSVVCSTIGPTHDSDSDPMLGPMSDSSRPASPI